MVCMTVGKDGLHRMQGGMAYNLMQLREGQYVVVMEVVWEDEDHVLQGAALYIPHACVPSLR